jgi:hypothetical protein
MTYSGVAKANCKPFSASQLEIPNTGGERFGGFASPLSRAAVRSDFEEARDRIRPSNWHSAFRASGYPKRFNASKKALIKFRI